VQTEDDGTKCEEIGERMGLTRERVRQIREKALKKLKSSGRKKLLREFCAQ